MFVWLLLGVKGSFYKIKDIFGSGVNKCSE